MSLTTINVEPSLTAMPADSWPPVLEGVEAVEHDGGDAAPGSEYPEPPHRLLWARVLNRTAHLSILARAEQLSRTGGVNVVAR